ncbi:BTAD domain-containing putative transcriptional regulator [Nocardia sp. NPDC051570]|uniref:AfsR/SARP family transcriptional regulator n=1 Tax=Nocardia sp. NPDC051570 TaxID=3364324 RepID=UPI0037BD66C6
MRISVLGELKAEDGECIFTPHATKPRQLIALLALNANRVVSNEILIEELWHDAAVPQSAIATLQTYIFQLRMGLTYTPGCAGDRGKARERLITKPFGYQLRLGDDEFDVSEFKARISRASEAGEAGRHTKAIEYYSACIRMFRGPALIGLHTGPVLQAHARQLEELLLSVHEARVRHLLLIGRFSEAISDLSPLTVRHPLHEGLHVQMIRALSRSGRRSESLKIYQDIRRRLIDEVGIEPSVALQGAQREALCIECHAS